MNKIKGGKYNMSKDLIAFDMVSSRQDRTAFSVIVRGKTHPIRWLVLDSLCIFAAEVHCRQIIAEFKYPLLFDYGYRKHFSIGQMRLLNFYHHRIAEVNRILIKNNMLRSFKRVEIPCGYATIETYDIVIK